MFVEAGQDFLDFGEEVVVCFVGHTGSGVVRKCGAAHSDDADEVMN